MLSNKITRIFTAKLGYPDGPAPGGRRLIPDGVSRLFLGGLIVIGQLCLGIQPLAAAQMNHSAHTESSAGGDRLPNLPVGDGSRTYAGEAKQLGNGTIRSWVRIASDGRPASIGVTFTESALAGLPAEPPPGQVGTEYPIALPAEASATPFKHIVVDWNPHGHEPQHVYDVGHFDFHFYLISPAEREAITAQGDDLVKCRKLLPPECVPAGYIYAPGAEVPRMGAHWVDVSSHEFHGHAFTATYIYGSYDGRLIFEEPMITKAFLETKPDLTQPVTLPARFQKPGYYPTRYSVKYDPASKEYTVSLDGLTLQGEEDIQP